MTTPAAGEDVVVAHANIRERAIGPCPCSGASSWPSGIKVPTDHQGKVAINFTAEVADPRGPWPRLRPHPGRRHEFRCDTGWVSQRSAGRHQPATPMVLVTPRPRSRDIEQ